MLESHSKKHILGRNWICPFYGWHNNSAIYWITGCSIIRHYLCTRNPSSTCGTIHPSVIRILVIYIWSSKSYFSTCIIIIIPATNSLNSAKIIRGIIQMRITHRWRHWCLCLWRSRCLCRCIWRCGRRCWWWRLWNGRCLRRRGCNRNRRCYRRSWCRRSRRYRH